MISALTVHLLLKFARINSISAVVEAMNNEIQKDYLKVCGAIKNQRPEDRRCM